MTTAGAIKIGVGGGKPTDLIELVTILTEGAGDKKPVDASDSEYIDEQWWPIEDEAKPVDGGPG